MADKSENAFTNLLKRLVRVPKHEIDQQEEKFRDKREADEYKEQRRPIVPTPTAPRQH